jgi:hypothetical protein
MQLLILNKKSKLLRFEPGAVERSVDLDKEDILPLWIFFILIGDRQQKK